MYAVVCVLLSALLSFLSVFGVNPRPAEAGESTAVISVTSKKTELKNEFTLGFDRQKVNTAEISFKSEGKATVSIYCGEERIYCRTGIEQYRFCAFKTIQTDSLRFVVEGNSVKSVSLSFKTAHDDDFRITAYVVASNIQGEQNYHAEHFDVITDVILFGCVRFDEQGEISTDTETLEKALFSLRNVIGDRRTNIYFNILGPSADNSYTDWNRQMNEMASRYSKAFRKKKLLTGINELVEKYDFDGVFFDYEYPLKAIYWNDFRVFLNKLDKALAEDKKIGVAACSWNLSVAGNITDCADMVELMQYDIFNSNGEHSSFDTCVEGFEEAEKMLLKRSKLDMGIPFYGRPSDSGGYWPDYASNAAKLENGSDGAMTDSDGYCFFNSPQTVYDKTAYCLSRGIGGMMIWHYSCDVPDTDSEYSLIGAMSRCLEDRNIG